MELCVHFEKPAFIVFFISSSSNKHFSIQFQFNSMEHNPSCIVRNSAQRCSSRYRTGSGYTITSVLTTSIEDVLM